MGQPDLSSSPHIGSVGTHQQLEMAGRRCGTRGPDQSIRDSGRRERDSRCSRHAVASCGGRSPSAVSDAAATRFAARAAVPGSVADVRCRAAERVAADCSRSDAAVAERVVAACSGPAAAAVAEHAAACSGLAAAVAGHAVAACSGLAAAVAGHALAACSGLAAAVAGHAVAVGRAVVGVWPARAYSLAVGGGLVFRPRAVRKQEQQFREAKTEWLC